MIRRHQAHKEQLEALRSLSVRLSWGIAALYFQAQSAGFYNYHFII